MKYALLFVLLVVSFVHPVQAQSACRELIEARKHAEALPVCDAEIAQDKTNTNAHLARARALFNLKKYPEAIASAERAIATGKDNEAREKSGKYKADISMAFFVIGFTQLLHLDKPKAALETYTAGLQHDDRDARLYVRRGDAHLVLNEYIKAIYDYERGLYIDPKQAGSFPGLVQAYAGALEKEDNRDYRVGLIKYIFKAVSADPAFVTSSVYGAVYDWFVVHKSGYRKDIPKKQNAPLDMLALALDLSSIGENEPTIYTMAMAMFDQGTASNTCPQCQVEKEKTIVNTKARTDKLAADQEARQKAKDDAARFLTLPLSEKAKLFAAWIDTVDKNPVNLPATVSYSGTNTELLVVNNYLTGGKQTECAVYPHVITAVNKNYRPASIRKALAEHAEACELKSLAVRLYGEAIKTQSSVPGAYEVRLNLVPIYAQRAKLYEELGQFAEALSDYLRVRVSDGIDANVERVARKAKAAGLAVDPSLIHTDQELAADQDRRRQIKLAEDKARAEAAIRNFNTTRVLRSDEIKRFLGAVAAAVESFERQHGAFPNASGRSASASVVSVQAIGAKQAVTAYLRDLNQWLGGASQDQRSAMESEIANLSNVEQFLTATIQKWDRIAQGR